MPRFTSPIDGVVINRAVEEGQTVAGRLRDPTLFTIVRRLDEDAGNSGCG